MIPNVSSALLGWTEVLQMKEIKKTPVAFESQENTVSVESFEVLALPLHSRDVNRKPEGLRIYKWLQCWSKHRVQKDTTLQDQDGKQYRVQWSSDYEDSGGFWNWEMTQQPRGLGVQP